MIDLQPLGDRAWLGRFASGARARAWASAVRELREPGVADVVVAYETVAVYADPAQVDLSEFEGHLRGLDCGELPRLKGTHHQIPTLYDGADLPTVATRLGLAIAAVVEAHCSQDFTVFAVGFQPGYPYAGPLPPALAGLPRRTSPRTTVPAGSVALAGRQTGIYPAESPGGWHLIGRTPLSIVDVARGRFSIRAGDTLRFVPIDRAEYESRRGEVLATSPLE